MLLELEELVKEFKMDIKGVIHIGAHRGQEVPTYRKLDIREIALFEPNEDALRYLRQDCKDCQIYDVALSNIEGEADMFVSADNQGQSNSLLEPAKHLQAHPEIKFNGKNSVRVRMLDRVGLDIGRYNMINIDVQGAELMVFKGATESLQHIDYVYTEVNFDETYKGNALVGELDSFLGQFGFVRVATNDTPGIWGDALYIKRKALDPRTGIHIPAIGPGGRQLITEIENDFINGFINPDFVEKVPVRFRPHMAFDYPSDNYIPFEEWFYLKFGEKDIREGMTYLPVFWSSYYVNNNYGKAKSAIHELQQFLDSLDKSKKYYTIVQYDDGILNDISGLDLKVFAMSGKLRENDYPLPLICAPHQFEFNKVRKDLFISFVGRLETNLIRQRMVKALPQKSAQIYISDTEQPIESYCHILARSKYVLAPRGYGQTSFRVCEALQFGAIPVYISDEFIYPHNSKGNYSFGVTVNAEKMNIIEKINRYEQEHGYSELSLDGTVELNTERIAKVTYKQYFTFAANKAIILDQL